MFLWHLHSQRFLNQWYPIPYFNCSYLTNLCLYHQLLQQLTRLLLRSFSYSKHWIVQVNKQLPQQLNSNQAHLQAKSNAHYVAGILTMIIFFSYIRFSCIPKGKAVEGLGTIYVMKWHITSWLFTKLDDFLSFVIYHISSNIFLPWIFSPLELFPRQLFNLWSKKLS